MVIKKFYGFFFWFPLVVALFLSAIRFLFPDLESKSISIIIIILICVFFSTLLLNRDNVSKSVKYIIMPIGILALTFSLRIIWVLVFGHNVPPHSDFSWAYEAAKGSSDYIHRHATYPSWGYYVYFLKYFFKVTGPTYNNVQILNAFINSFSAVLIYFISLLSIENYKIALISSTFYAFMFSNILYTNILTPEFLSIMFLLTVILLMIITFKYMIKIYIRILIWIIIGICIGLMNFFKPIGLIILIAYIITQIMFLQDIKSLISISLSIIVICSIFLGIGAIGKNYLEKQLGTDVNDYTLSHFMFVGLNTKGEGQVHIGEYNHLDERLLAENGYNYKETNEWVYDFLHDDWSKNYKDIVGLFTKKIEWAWQDDLVPSKYTLKQSGINLAIEQQGDLRKKMLSNLLPSLSQSYYIYLLIFSIIGSYEVKKSHHKNKSLFLIFMYVFGFVLVLLISESQSRYKCMATPIMCIIASIGFTSSFDKIKNILARHKKNCANT